MREALVSIIKMIVILIANNYKEEFAKLLLSISELKNDVQLTTMNDSLVIYLALFFGINFPIFMLYFLSLIKADS
jgi:hypothetical protein